MRWGVIAAIAIACSGCATPKIWSATGGSRSDGVVRLAYEFGEFEKPQLDEAQAVRLASERCGSWGYQGAEAFGGTTQQCNQSGGLGGCARWIVTKEYQCVGAQSPQ